MADGDTIRVRLNGDVYSVRYIGIDAPEPGSEPLARESTEANEQLVDGEPVYLETDVSDVDQYDRLLRHVWLQKDGTWMLASEEIVKLGLADARTYRPDTMYDDLLAAAEADAKAAGLGIWALAP